MQQENHRRSICAGMKGTSNRTTVEFYVSTGTWYVVVRGYDKDKKVRSADRGRLLFPVPLFLLGLCQTFRALLMRKEEAITKP